MRWWTFGYHTMQTISWKTEKLLASRSSYTQQFSSSISTNGSAASHSHWSTISGVVNANITTLDNRHNWTCDSDVSALESASDLLMDRDVMQAVCSANTQTLRFNNSTIRTALHPNVSATMRHYEANFNKRVSKSAWNKYSGKASARVLLNAISTCPANFNVENIKHSLFL